MSCEVFPYPILLVEDDPLPAATMKRYLSRLSTDVQVAETADQAENAWRANPPGLVLMDYRLPDGLGTDVVAKQRAKGFREPVICMTGEAEMISETMRKNLEIHSVLNKPVMLDMLRETILELAETKDSVSVQDRQSQEKVRRIGKFRIVHLPKQLSKRNFERLSMAARNETWLALDVSKTTEVDTAVWPDLCALAGWFSSKGGRMYLIAQPEEQCARIKSFVGSYIEVFPHTDRLRVEGARLTGALERKALLAAVQSAAAEEEKHE